MSDLDAAVEAGAVALSKFGWGANEDPEESVRAVLEAALDAGTIRFPAEFAQFMEDWKRGYHLSWNEMANVRLPAAVDRAESAEARVAVLEQEVARLEAASDTAFIALARIDAEAGKALGYENWLALIEARAALGEVGP